MYQFLLDHAIKNVWCTPEQDNQLIFCAHRVTKTTGELNRFKLMNRRVNLPTQGKRFHVFQVGQVQPKMTGLLSLNPQWGIEKWIQFSEAVNTLKLFTNIYTSPGIELPRFKTYYMFTVDRDLIFAVEEDKNYPIQFSEDKIYVRLYTNAYFQSSRADASLEYLHCEGIVVKNTNDILFFQLAYAAYAAKDGYTFAYKNGLLVDGIDLVNIAVNDTVEFIYDSSVKRVVTFTVADLKTFNSTLDSKYKYLLHHTDALNDTIDFHDDIDIHILHQQAPGRYRGYYYHRNLEDSHRMVTHRDYSIAVDYVNYIAGYLNQAVSATPIDYLQLKVQVKIRDSGYQRPLIFDNSRIFELYKLPNPKITQAMVGIDAVVDEWKAASLEASFYTALMREKRFSNINIEMIQKGYGYNSISKLVGDTPTKTVLKSSRQSANLPYNLYENCTVYEYDADGTMLGYHSHSLGNDYECVDNNARMIEVISGDGSNKPDVTFGTDNIPLPIYDNYRVYSCHYVNGVPDEVWTDVTGSNLYTVVNNTLVWGVSDYSQYLMVRTDTKFLAYDIPLLPVAGTLYFTFSELENRTGIYENYMLPVPLGELDIFLNGRSLIRGLDYIVHFPKVYIINKKHLVQPANSTIQNIHVRFTGFCKSDLSLDAIEDYGFVEHGFLSNNNRFDIRDDKVLRITMNGGLKHRDDLLFSELHDGISVVNPINGNPYQIKDIVVPLKQLVNENTYSLRDKSIVIDKKISDYMTIKLPQPLRSTVSSITERYPIISPFICHLVNDMASGQIDSIDMISPLTDNRILEICNPYEFLLKFDPISLENNLNDHYVIIIPHNLDMTINLTIYQYRFLLRVMKLYCRGLVDLSSFVTFSA